MAASAPYKPIGKRGKPSLCVFLVRGKPRPSMRFYCVVAGYNWNNVPHGEWGCPEGRPVLDNASLSRAGLLRRPACFIMPENVSLTELE